MHKAVVFDIDGTLTKNISWVVLTEGVGASIHINDSFVRECRLGKISLEQLEKEIVKNWATGGKNTKKDFYEILDAIPLREDAIDTINYLKEKGYTICLITGSFDLYAQIVSEKVGVNKRYATTFLVWDNEDTLTNIKTVLDDGKRKIEYFNDFIAEHGLRPEECIAIGDSYNDIDLFKLTGNGIAVRTGTEANELHNVAWKIVDDLAELKNIL